MIYPVGVRIIQLTPGTGNFHCGSCLRDTALVRALRARGHDALMVPLYLPIVTDDPPAGESGPIFLGGINVYLQQKFSFFRGAHWLNSPALLRAAARLMGLTSARDLGELTLSMLQGEAGQQAREIERLISWLRGQSSPDVICLSNSLLAGLARRLKEQFGTPIVCALQGEDSFLDALPDPYRAQAWQLLAKRCADIDRFVAPSRFHGERMRARLGFDNDRLVVVPNGIVLEGFAPAPAPPDPPTVGYLTRMHHAKGLATLVDAFVQLKRWDRIPNLQLRIAGAQTAADAPFVRALERRLAANGLREQARFIPNLDRAAKQEFLRRLSVFSVPATSGEAFGLYVLESLASGVPVVQPRHGAFPELLEQTGGGVLCEPDDPAALAEAIQQLLLDPRRARELGEEGRRTVQAQFNDTAMARNIETVLRQVTHAA